MPKIKVKGQTVQIGKRPQTNRHTHGADATKRIIFPATRSIKIDTTKAHFLHKTQNMHKSSQAVPRTGDQIAVGDRPDIAVATSVSATVRKLSCPTWDHTLLPATQQR